MSRCDALSDSDETGALRHAVEPLGSGTLVTSRRLLLAGFLDPEKKLFSHRILSRDECIDPFPKTGNLRCVPPRSCGHTAWAHSEAAFGATEQRLSAAAAGPAAIFATTPWADPPSAFSVCPSGEGTQEAGCVGDMAGNRAGHRKWGTVWAESAKLSRCRQLSTQSHLRCDVDGAGVLQRL